MASKPLRFTTIFVGKTKGQTQLCECGRPYKLYGYYVLQLGNTMSNTANVKRPVTIEWLAELIKSLVEKRRKEKSEKPVDIPE